MSVDSTIVLDCKPALDAEATPLPATPPGRRARRRRAISGHVTYSRPSACDAAPASDPDAGVWTGACSIPRAQRCRHSAGCRRCSWTRWRPSVGFDWDADVHREGRLDPRRLLVNARTPYSYTIGVCRPTTSSLPIRSPGWPCCERFPKPRTGIASTGPTRALGTRAPLSERFTDSASTFQWLTPRPPIVVAVVNEQHAARLRAGEAREGLLALARFDARAFACEIFVQWSAAHSNVSLVVEAFDGLSLVESPHVQSRRGVSAGSDSARARERVHQRHPAADGRIRRSGRSGRVGRRRDAGSLPHRRRGARLAAWPVRAARRRRIDSSACGASRGCPITTTRSNCARASSSTTSVSGAQSATLEQSAFFRTKGSARAERGHARRRRSRARTSNRIIRATAIVSTVASRWRWRSTSASTSSRRSTAFRCRARRSKRPSCWNGRSRSRRAPVRSASSVSRSPARTG